MGEMVTCRDTGKQIPIEEAYTKSNKKAKKKVWYSSKEGYDWWNEWNRKCIDKLTELTLDKNMRFPSMAAKMLKESPNIELTYLAIDLAASDLEWAIRNKEFYSEYGRWKYLFTIIDGHYNDAVRINNALEKDKTREQKEIEFDGDYDIPVKHVENRNIARFLA